MSNLSVASRTRINIPACVESKGPSSDNYRQVHSVLYVLSYVVEYHDKY